MSIESINQELSSHLSLRKLSEVVNEREREERGLEKEGEREKEEREIGACASSYLIARYLWLISKNYGIT